MDFIKIILVVFLLFTLNAKADRVDKALAEKVAVKFIRSLNLNDYNSEVYKTDEMIFGNESSMYLIHLKPKGWVLISAEDKVNPVLAFSFKSKFDQSDSNLLNYLKVYDNQISWIKNQSNFERDSRWDELISENTLKSATATNIVGPLIEVEWNQGRSWNRFCPEDEDGPGDHAYVGCVAVAMAQSMSVFSYPAKAVGTKSYSHPDYGTIVAQYDKDTIHYNWDNISKDSADIYNSTLLYDCAVSVEMNFGSDGSGTQTRKAVGAMKEYFKYPDVIKTVGRYANDEEWIALLKAEIDSGRPIIYSGDADDGEAGHAFNIDGYLQSYFHLNWGWSGSNNGYFTIDNLKPGTFDFTKNQDAIIGIRIPIAKPTDLLLSHKTVKEKKPIGTAVAKISVEDEVSENPHSFTVHGAKISDENYEQASFYIENDSLKTLKVFNYSEEQNLEVNIVVSDTLGNTYEEKFTISIEQNTASKKDINLSEIVLYPNPVNTVVKLNNIQYSNYHIQILTFDGKIVDRSDRMLTGRQQEFNTGHLKPGIYFLQLIDADNQQHKILKFVKQ